MLGLTAIPERLDNKDVFAICDYNTVYEVRLASAINKGWLVLYRYYGIYDDAVDYDGISFKNGKYDENQLEKALMINKRAELILRHYQKYNSKRALDFYSTRKHVEYMADYFCKNGVKTYAVVSNSTSSYSMDRTKAINNLQKVKYRLYFQ